MNECISKNITEEFVEAITNFADGYISRVKVSIFSHIPSKYAASGISPAECHLTNLQRAVWVATLSKKSFGFSL